MPDPVSDGAGGRVDLPFRRSMPAPVLFLFAAVAAGGLALVVVLIARPGTFGIPVAERRSPPRGVLSHDVGRMVPAPAPSPLPATASPCADLAGVVVEGGPPAQGRLGLALQTLCRTFGTRADLDDAIRALATARIHFATFARSGDASTTDLSARRILLDIRFSRSRSAVVDIVPLLAHEGYHLARSGQPVTAGEEFAARGVELLVCRLIIDIRRWPRGCEDARALADMGERAGVDALVRAGYPR
jgi:hypothetical protein